MNAAHSQTDGLHAYHQRLARHGVLIAVLAAAAAGAFMLDLTTGPASLSPLDVLQALVGAGQLSPAQQVIVWDLRLPAAIMAVLVGAALALSGAEMQTILANPLAEPFTLGVSSSAALGAAVALVLGSGVPGVPQAWLLPANAFIFALGSLLILQALTRLRGAGADTLILFGIALGFTAAALLTLLQFIASADTLQLLVFWSMGSLARANWQTVTVIAVVVALITPLSLASSWKMTVLRLGEDRAKSAGVDVTRLRRLSLLRISLLAATAVAFVGIIGFVGLVGPHVARLLVGEDHRYLLPTSLLTGALMMSLASVASKLIVPGILLPIGVVTALVGLPVFFLLIVQRQGKIR